MTVGQKDWNRKLMMGTSHSTSRNRNILRRGREAGDKCCLETGKEDILARSQREARRKRHWTN